MVKNGDPVPSVSLDEGSPGNTVDPSAELASGEGLIIGVPAAFSPGCSETHIPGYVASHKTKQAGKVFVVSVNDAFVMKAWGKQLDPDGASGIRWLADKDGSFSKKLDTLFDASGMMGNQRSARYALVTKDGKITSANVEPDNIGITVSSVESVLGG